MSSMLKMKESDENIADLANISSLGEMVARAADVLAPVWPLKTFIACNPLQGLEDLPFEQATAKALSYRALDSIGSGRVESGRVDSGRFDSGRRQAVNREMIKWSGAFLDEGQATLAMPNRHLGFYRAFADLARFDTTLRKNRQVAGWLKALPENAAGAIIVGLNRLNVSHEDREEFIRQMLAALPGWAGYVKWRNDWQDKAQGQSNPITLVDFVAVRTVVTCALWPNAKVAKITTPVAPGYLDNLPRAEGKFREGLLGKLLPQAQRIGASDDLSHDENVASKHRPAAQLAFCIDVRSEPFRRNLEAVGDYQTLGFAGFFGLPVRVKSYGDEQPHDSCPVLLKPSYDVYDRCVENDPSKLHQHDRGRGVLASAKSFYQALKYNFASPFALVEILGPWFGLRMLLRTIAPSVSAARKKSAESLFIPGIHTDPDLGNITTAEQVVFGESALRMMGLTENIAPLVVFCGHGSTTNNNAYAAGLDCGACGGNPGGSNAKILAAMLNRQDIRDQICAGGLVIPEDTVFVAAEHDTTTDAVTIYDQPTFGAVHKKMIGQLTVDLAKAGANNSLGRCATFGLSPNDSTAARQSTARRSHDWAEVRPEWGLARNAAFIVGPRELTYEVNLEGRCFLHSYDWKADDGAKFLETILTAPMVVAQWINNQYLFSTLDNVSYGAGSKVTKNITGKLGVMQGNASDLMHGLPLQSVFASDNKPYHEPLRLLTVVYAPRQTVEQVVRRCPVLQKLFFNGWVSLTVIDPYDQKPYVYKRDATWMAI